MTTHTHQDLCEIAVRWLKRYGNGIGCHVAVSEISSSNREQADAFGYCCAANNRHGSWLVEVKISRADFLVDAKKPHRINPELGVGKHRVYMCPEEVIELDDISEDWGLVWVNKRGHVSIKREPQPIKHYNHLAESYILARLLSRLGDQEKYNQMLKESSRLSTRAWRQVESLTAQKKSIVDQYEQLISRLQRDYNIPDDQIISS